MFIVEKYGKYICDECYEKYKNKYLFRKIENENFDYIFCSSFYTNFIKNKIHNFKFFNKSYLYMFFIELSLRNEKIVNFLKNFDLITYIPMNLKKEDERGYNQSKLLSEELGKKLGIKVEKLLEKQKQCKTQSKLSEKEREENIKDAFKFVNNKGLKNKNIILVDDILTTGSTIREASKILKESGANKICIFAIAKTKLKKSNYF